MTYPSPERYQEVLQHPRTAFRGDAELAAGKVAADGFGLPLVMCGGFALTYTFTVAQNRKVALRCFHKESRDLEGRYRAVSAYLEKLNSKYFVLFSFDRNGIWVDGASYPIVKMAWADGITLGEFVEQHHADAAKLTRLTDALRGLARYLETQGIAHGDIQPGNVMVSPDGGALRLIDYDGIYVPELAGMQSAELGHRNFQHPMRNQTLFNAKLDRFSFIVLDLALRAVRDVPQLWDKTHSDGDSFIFRANDFASPQTSGTFAALSRIGGIAKDVGNFARICVAGVERVPPLSAFIVGQGVPDGPTYEVPASGAKFSRGRYLPVYTVVDAARYDAALAELGEVVELVGQVKSVRKGKTHQGKGPPYAFVNFGNWKTEDSVRLTIWSQVLLKMKDSPHDSWEGDWISVSGLLQRRVDKNGRVVLQLVLSSPTQIHHIDEQEALYRLDSTRPGAMRFETEVRAGSAPDNVSRLAQLGFDPQAKPPLVVSRPQQTAPNVAAVSKGGNAQLLANMGPPPPPSTVRRSASGVRMPAPVAKPAGAPPVKSAPTPVPGAPPRASQQRQPAANPTSAPPSPRYHQTPSSPPKAAHGLPGWVYVALVVCFIVLVAMVSR